jgi:coiled-coil domain-containing protein 115
MSDPIARLDVLLETYLNRLDTYQKLREKLSINCSAGFLSLAHANRTSNLGSGRRYGEEGYDERMKAVKRLTIRLHDEVDLGGPIQQDLQNDEQPSPHPDPAIIFLTIEQSDPSGIKVADRVKSHVPPETPPEDPKPSTKAKQPLNPLNWYGLLVPPSLRAAQASFISAVQDQIPQLLNIQTDMAGLEAQIRALRKEAGLTHKHTRSVDSTTTTQFSQSDTHSRHLSVTLKPAASSPNRPGKAADKHSRAIPSKENISPLRTLPSRPIEPPRSRVLKSE